MNMFDTEPLTLDLAAVDMSHTLDSWGRDVITMTLFDSTGLRIACPMERSKAEAFGRSLADYATEQAPAWLPPTTPAKAAARMTRWVKPQPAEA